MISLATGVIIGLSGILGGSATMLAEDAISRKHVNPERIDKLSEKIGNKAKANIKKRHEKEMKKNPDIEITSEQVDADFKAEADKLIRRNAIKETIVETVIPAAIGGLATVGTVMLYSLVADACADSDDDVDVDDEE